VVHQAKDERPNADADQRKAHAPTATGRSLLWLGITRRVERLGFQMGHASHDPAHLLIRLIRDADRELLGG